MTDADAAVGNLKTGLMKLFRVIAPVAAGFGGFLVGRAIGNSSRNPLAVFWQAVLNTLVPGVAGQGFTSAAGTAAVYIRWILGSVSLFFLTSALSGLLKSIENVIATIFANMVNAFAVGFSLGWGWASIQGDLKDGKLGLPG